MEQDQFSELPSWKKWALILSSFIPVLLGRVVWQSYPGIVPCVIFWILALADDPLRWNLMGGRRKRLFQMAFLGGLGNAIATISNGGRMPVENLTKPVEGSLWIPMLPTHNFQWLCDIHGGASIGDFLIITAVIGMFVNWLLERAELLPKEAVVKNKRLPGLGIG